MEAGKLQWRRQRISGAGQTARRAVQGRIASARKADCVIAPKAPHRAKATICDPAERSQIERRSSGMSKPCRWRQGAGEGELPRRGKRGWPGPYGACDDAGGGTAKPCRRGCGLMGLFCAEITAQTRRGDPCGRPEADSRTRKRATARVAPTGSCRSTDHCTKSDPTTPQSAPPTAPLAQGSLSEGARRKRHAQNPGAFGRRGCFVRCRALGKMRGSRRRFLRWRRAGRQGWGTSSRREDSGRTRRGCAGRTGRRRSRAATARR